MWYRNLTSTESGTWQRAPVTCSGTVAWSGLHACICRTREHRLSILRRSNGRFVLFLILDRSSYNCPNDRFRTITKSLSTLRRPPERYALLMPIRPYKRRSPCATVSVSPLTRPPPGTRWFRSRAGPESKSGGAAHAVSEMVESIRAGAR